MFCNDPKTDEGDIAHLGPTTITGMTILKVLFVLDHDSGRYRWFGWARQPQITILFASNNGKGAVTYEHTLLQIMFSHLLITN